MIVHITMHSACARMCACSECENSALVMVALIVSYTCKEISILLVISNEPYHVTLGINHSTVCVHLCVKVVQKV